MKYYVSVTGLKVKSIWHHPQFWLHAVPSAIQAQSAPGIVEARTTARNGIQHTLTVWEDRKHMLRYLREGAHLKAMKVTAQVSDPAGTKVYGYESDTIPTWEEALALWEVHGTRHGKLVPTLTSSSQASQRELLKSSLPFLAMMMAVGAMVVISTGQLSTTMF